MCKNISKNIGKNAIGKYSQKLFDSAKQSTTDPCKNSSKRKIRKTMEVSSDSKNYTKRSMYYLKENKGCRICGYTCCYW